MQFSKSYTVTEATKKMERYCAYQERCHKEVQNKLAEMRMIPEAIDQIIGHLIQSNFLNEERFARAFARGKFNQKSWGRNRIVRELVFREISKYNIQKALDEISEEAYKVKLSHLAQKKLDQISENNVLKRKRKLSDYLLYRGWEEHLVYEKIRELIG